MKTLSALILSLITFFSGLLGISVPVSKATANLILSPTASVTEIRLRGPNTPVSSLAFRLVYHYNGPAPTAPQILPNTALTASSWSFPVHQAKVDPIKKEVVFDLAAINTRPNGFTLGSDLELAKINLTGGFTLDLVQSILITKNGVSIPLEIK